MSEGSQYNKDFEAWNYVKQITHTEQSRLYTVREIWWCRLGINIGTEQNGKGEWYVRPCIIIKGFGADACLVIPLTTSLRKHFLRVDVGAVDGVSARANISQMRTIDTRRLSRKIGFLDKDIFTRLKKVVKDML
jgi:mRNA interferase MazF